MTDNPIQSVHALNIYLFAYYLKFGLTNDLQQFQNTHQEVLEKIYTPISQKFQPQFGIELTPELIADQPNLLTQDLLKTKRQYREFEQWSSQAKNQHPDQPKPLYNLLLYFQKLGGDTYSLMLDIYRPQQTGYDTVKVEEFAQFHPQDLIVKKSQHNKDNQGFIGQTLLVTAFLPENTNTKPDNLRKIADFLRSELFGETLPPFYQDGKILDSYIYEYSQQKEKGDRLLIILYLNENTSDKMMDIIYDIPRFFLAYHKIIYTFQSSRKWHDDADKLVRQIEENLQKLIVSSNTTELEALKIQLKALMTIAPKYSLQMRNLEYALNTINIQKQNYQNILDNFRDTTDDQLEFFQRFLTEQTFTQQIEYDLNYLKPASNLLDQAINSIRGIVEIEQAKIDIAKTESDRSLERTIQILGVGLGVGGIVSSTISGYIQEPVSFTPDFSKPMHPGVFSLFISLLLGILAALMMAGFIYRSYLLEKIKKYFTTN